MTRIGYHCSHEQYPPSRLLELVQLAERAGFESAMCSDHFHPWSERQGHSGFAWSWIAAALQATSFPIGMIAIPGGWRYHPAIVGQAAATLAEMYPGRFWIAPGSGEALNEHIVGQHWPHKAERNARLLEAVEIIRALWSGETVTRTGLIRVEDAKLYVRPQEPPPMIGAALSPETAEWMGGWADGLITTLREREAMEEMVRAFRRGGGEGKPIYLQAQLSFGRTDEDALRAAWDQWRSVQFPSPVLAHLWMPAQFDAVGEFVRPEDLRGKIKISADPEWHLEWLRECVDLGFEEIFLHCLNRDEQERFIEVFGERVLPELRGAR
ncbi:MAG TPA: TIGR03885 family FMN-dependent LLM class oxidoreductase [Longimicrobiaceae bacterium]|nr:TIGR03885 family FMN-dependent LLM class oxidoreductase [Longimicrobiaceae bacterium]